MHTNDFIRKISDDIKPCENQHRTVVFVNLCEKFDEFCCSRGCDASAVSLPSSWTKCVSNKFTMPVTDVVFYIQAITSDKYSMVISTPEDHYHSVTYRVTFDGSKWSEILDICYLSDIDPTTITGDDFIKARSLVDDCITSMGKYMEFTNGGE